RDDPHAGARELARGNELLLDRPQRLVELPAVEVRAAEQLADLVPTSQHADDVGDRMDLRAHRRDELRRPLLLVPAATAALLEPPRRRVLVERRRVEPAAPQPRP